MLSTLHPDRSFPTANPFPNPFRHTAQSLPVCQSMYVLFFRLQHVEASTQIRIFFVAWFRCVASSQPKTFPATVASPTAAKSEARERERELCFVSSDFVGQVAWKSSELSCQHSRRNRPHGASHTFEPQKWGFKLLESLITQNHGCAHQTYSA